MWDKFNNAIDQVCASKDEIRGCPFTDDEVIKLNHDGICAEKLVSIDIFYKPRMFAPAISGCAYMSHVSMALGSVFIDDTACDIFMENASAMLTTAFATIAAVSAGGSKGVNAEHLAKVWCIPHDDAARTIQVKTNSSVLIRTCLFHALLGQMTRWFDIRKLRAISFLICSL
jgi:hypothetical protein